MRFVVPLLLAFSLAAGACASETSALDLVDPAAPPADGTAAGDDTGAPTTAVVTTTTTSTTTTTTTSTSTTEAPVVWNLVGGGQIEPGSIEGQDTVLWFWAPW